MRTSTFLFRRSVVTATVMYSAKTSVVDAKRIQQILDKDYRDVTPTKDYTTETTGAKEASGSNLWWILILLIVLLLLLAALLVLCCICEPCPLYVPPRKRKIRSAREEATTAFVVRGSGHGRRSRSVQVAEWFGRKEAWSPEAPAVQAEKTTSERRTLQRQQNVNAEPARDQYYIRDGNAEILRLITRGGEQQRPITLVADQQQQQLDSGKDILMRRYFRVKNKLPFPFRNGR